MKAIREKKIQEGAFAMKLQKKDDSISQLLRDIERKYRVMENLRSTQDLAVANTYMANCQFLEVWQQANDMMKDLSSDAYLYYLSVKDKQEGYANFAHCTVDNVDDVLLRRRLDSNATNAFSSYDCCRR
jgi:hypothetical protein